MLYCIYAQMHLMIWTDEDSGREKVNIHNHHAFQLESTEAHLPQHRTQAAEATEEGAPLDPKVAASRRNQTAKLAKLCCPFNSQMVLAGLRNPHDTTS